MFHIFLCKIKTFSLFFGFLKKGENIHRIAFEKIETMSTKANSALEKAIHFSCYLDRIIKRNQQLKNHFINQYETVFTNDDFLGFADWYNLDEDDLKKQLRHLRQLVIGHLMIRDLNHDADLNEVIRTMSVFADFTVNTALDFAQSVYQNRYGEPIGEEDGSIQHLTVIGMGKLGGYELNVSSDIDLIFTYPQAGSTNGIKSTTNQEFFTKVGQKIINILNDTTDEGQVFRVDMRLRPYGDSGPLVISENALEHYLITQGREWERYAWLKARIVTPDSNNISELVRPFVYRKYLDFNAYEAMRNLHQQIKQDVARQYKTDNIKLGSGGIREAEFVAQIFQLIWGGKNRNLQLKGTQETLQELARTGYLTHSEKEALLKAYSFLRTLEHRLQYIDDQQTQTLPATSQNQDKIAQSMGYTHYHLLLATLSAHQKNVKKAFDTLLALPDKQKNGHALTTIWTHCHEADSTQNALAALGFSGKHIQLRLNTLKQGHKYKKLSSHAQALFDKLIPLLIEASSASNSPDLVFTRFLDFLETISRRSAYLALLCEHPETLKPLSDIFGASGWVSAYLMRHPILLDELLDARIVSEKPDWAVLSEELEQNLNQYKNNDTESKMDALRHFQHAQIFRLAVQDLSGLWSVESLSDQLSFLATTIIEASFKQVWSGLKDKHCEKPGVAVIGYGKLGGKELGYASDLDLIYIYQDKDPRAVETYSRFVRRLNTWLSSNTGAGDLYNIDLRLRPNGDAGLLICSFDAFRDYQNAEAWLWEHQALTRARFLCGDTETGVQFEQLRQTILTTPKETSFIHDEILGMRERIKDTRPPALENVKYARGGIVDVEFLVQYLILVYAGNHPDLTNNYGNIALLAMAADHGLIDSHLAEQSRVAYRYYRQIQHMANLRDIHLQVDDTLQSHYQHVKNLWQQVFNQKLP